MQVEKLRELAHRIRAYSCYELLRAGGFDQAVDTAADLIDCYRRRNDGQELCTGCGKSLSIQVMHMGEDCWLCPTCYAEAAKEQP